MPDLGRAFLAAVARSPRACAIVDGPRRLTYAEWAVRIGNAAAGLDALGLGPGDHLVTVLRNRLEAATLHWACQLAGVAVTPVNWRFTGAELAYVLADASSPGDTTWKPEHLSRPRVAETNPSIGHEGKT